MAAITTRTVYDYPHLLELQKVVLTNLAPKQVLRKKSFNLTWGACFLGMGTILILNYSVLVGVLLLLPGIWLMLRYLFFFQAMAWASARNLKGDQREHTFSFEEKYILARQGKDSAKYFYKDCEKLLESDGSIYVVLSGGQGIMLDKAHVSGGSPRQLVELLEHKTKCTALRVEV